MRDISRTVKTTVKSGSSVPATVIDVAGSKVSVRLSGDGAVYRNLGLVGGPVSVGSEVHVDFTTPEPTVVATGKSYEATFEALEEEIEAPMTETGDIVATESGMIEVFLPGEWSASGSAGDWWKDPNSGSYFDANSENLDVAISYAVPGSAIFIPRGEIGGNHAFWYGITLVGYGRGESFLTGQNTFRDGFHVRGVSFVSSGSSGGYEVGTTLLGGGYFYQCDFTRYNYGTGNSIGVCNIQRSVNVTFDECHFEAGIGLWGNPNGGVDSFQSGYAFYITEMVSPDWHVSYYDGGLRFQGEDSWSPGDWMLDGFALFLTMSIYDKSNVQIAVEWIARTDTGAGESNPYTSVGQEGHMIEDMSFFLDPVYGDPGHSGFHSGMTPEIPVEDESIFTSKNGSTSYTSYGPGDTLAHYWTHQDHGLGSVSGSAGAQQIRTVTNWLPYPASQPEYCYFWIIRRMGSDSSGSDARFNQNGYDLDLLPYRVYATDDAGWKEWIYPVTFNARLYQCSFDCNPYDVIAENYSTVIADSPSYNEIENKLGSVTLDSDVGTVVVSETAPSDPYPGQLWYAE